MTFGVKNSTRDWLVGKNTVHVGA